ncbi:hypothetical protein NECAME_03518 [Necator americanus]|uniref:Uncharacterized protein n=1 Tax=Necator americanus TaxID=51031 RepID=W2T2B3_NECAM|nr:hypothetical protein NECAME_03518 [Necator americanus]ETN76145.1 hypothetical protein NECAME_03518 [Necator americanus]
MSSPHSSASGSRAASPEDENGKPKSQSPSLPPISRLDRHAVCFFQGTNDTSSEIVPSKKWRPIVTYSQPVLTVPVRDQPYRAEQTSGQTPGRVIIVQVVVFLTSMFSGKLSNPVVEVPKNPSAISASIAQALGVTIVAPQRTSSTPISTAVMPPPIRTSVVRTKTIPSAAGLSSQQITSTVSLI